MPTGGGMAALATAAVGGILRGRASSPTGPGAEVLRRSRPAPRRFARRDGPAGVRTGRRVQRADGLRPFHRRLARRSLPFPLVLLLRADERGRPDAAGGPARCDLRRRPPGGDVPGAAAVSTLRGSEPGAACVRCSRYSARLALRAGERDRAGRRAELVARAPRRATPRRR